MNTDSKNAWVCPNDRELTLRARLDTGWSVKTSQLLNTFTKPEQINEAEQKSILQVITKSQQVEQLEKERINKMIERLNNIKRNARGDGKSSCVLCNEEFGLFGAQSHVCKDCNKSVCSKCSIDTLTSEKDGVWLCKICSETREMWKKSGAWFFNTMPNVTSQYTIPSLTPLSFRSDTASDSTLSLDADLTPQSSQYLELYND